MKKWEKISKMTVDNLSNSKEKFIDYLSNEYIYMQKKYLKSKLLFIFLNVFSFVMTTTIVIFTLIVIGKQIGGQRVTFIFVSISIISALIAFIIGIGGLLQMKNKKEIYKNRINKLTDIINNLGEKEKENDFDINKEIKIIGNSLFQTDDES